MRALLVMTVLGRDRPGLVDRVAEVVRSHDGNWLESRMARLGGQFAGILRVAVPEDRRAGLERALAELGREGLSVVVHRDEVGEDAQTGQPAILEVVGQDRPGIVREIAHALAQAGVNVEELETECRSAAMSGEPIFQARFQVSVPRACGMEDLRRRIEQLAEDLIVEVRFREEPAGTSVSPDDVPRAHPHEETGSD
ncbi:glycine cleavage system protein R [Limisphaera sp. 4302-co]|uniref:glycine cleavage system protein R n=1 Tax=Limisphaera sp. 4302-co TaxID=3400417 RepID=UPI003C24A8F4